MSVEYMEMIIYNYMIYFKLILISYLKLQKIKN